MLWTSRSEKRLTCLFARAATVVVPVMSVGVWQSAQAAPTYGATLVNVSRPAAMEAAPPGVSADGVGGARNRMKNPNCSMALITSALVKASVFVTELGDV